MHMHPTIFQPKFYYSHIHETLFMLQRLRLCW